MCDYFLYRISFHYVRSGRHLTRPTTAMAVPRLPTAANNGTAEFCSIRSGEAVAVFLGLAARPLLRLPVEVNNGTPELCSPSFGEAVAVSLDLAPRPLPRRPVVINASKADKGRAKVSTGICAIGSKLFVVTMCSDPFLRSCPLPLVKTAAALNLAAVLRALLFPFSTSKDDCLAFPRDARVRLATCSSSTSDVANVDKNDNWGDKDVSIADITSGFFQREN
uniref:Uncharacterized protein n=1 Tax=Glossina pallidipes TaxID=7398 RepID=A0A1A9ZW47_GLOPL